MRISIDVNDPGYHPEAIGTAVWLDGEEVDSCITADDQLGEVTVHPKGLDGRYLIDGDSLVTEVRKGVVRIILPYGLEAKLAA